jgi:Cd2+/Zn2+-exporting ATPase
VFTSRLSQFCQQHLDPLAADVVLETADIVLMADRLEKLEQMIRLGRRSQNIVKQNIVFALSFIVLLLLANLGANMTMPLGVIGHEALLF